MHIADETEELTIEKTITCDVTPEITNMLYMVTIYLQISLSS